MARTTEKDKQEFRDYLYTLTDNQVRHVYDKERSANRRAYTNLAKAEADRRGIEL